MLAMLLDENNIEKCFQSVLIKCLVNPLLSFSSSTAFGGSEHGNSQGLAFQRYDPYDQRDPWRLHAVSHPWSQFVQPSGSPNFPSLQ